MPNRVFAGADLRCVGARVVYSRYWRHCGCHRLFGSLHASVCGSGVGIEWGRDLSLKVDDGMDRPLMRSTSFGLGVFSSVISVVLEVIAAIPVIGVVLSLVEGVVIGAAGSYSYYGSYALEAALFGSLGLLVLALIASAILGVFFKMFADIAVMHFAVTGRVESAFSLDKVWAAFKHNKTKLF